MIWAEIAIGDLGRVVTGDTPPRKNPEYYGSAYPFIKPTDMTVGQRLTMSYEEGYSEDGFEKYRKKLIPAGSTAVVTIGSIGQKLTWLHADSFVNQAVNAVVPDRARFDSLYVYYLLKHNLNLVKQADTGASSGRENVSKSNFSSLTVRACLDLNTQKQIAEVLDALDSSIETNQRRIALLEDAARRLYREWFVHLRFPGYESVPVKDGVPEGWLVRNLFDVCDVDYGYPFRADQFNTDGIGMPAIRIRDIPDVATSTYTAEEVDSSYIVKRGDFLIGMDGIFHMNYWVGEDALLVQRVCRIRPKIELHRAYVGLAMHAPIKAFEATIQGATVAHLGAKHLRSIELLIPAALDEPLDYLNQTLWQQIQLREVNRKLANARDLLLPKLMSGQLDVSGISLPEEIAA